MFWRRKKKKPKIENPATVYVKYVTNDGVAVGSVVYYEIDENRLELWGDEIDENGYSITPRSIYITAEEKKRMKISYPHCFLWEIVEFDGEYVLIQETTI